MAMLLRLMQLGRKPLPVCNYTKRQIASQYKWITGIDFVVLMLMGPHEVLLEFDKETNTSGME